MKKISRNEMKNVMGGTVPDCHTSCQCNGSVGSWEYTSTQPIATSTLQNDVTTYCSSGSGTCTCSAV